MRLKLLTFTFHVVTKGHTYLSKPATKNCRPVQGLSTYKFLSPSGIKGLINKITENDFCS